MAALVAAIRRARPDIDLLRLERLLPEHGGERNPLVDLPHAPSPNVSLACSLSGGFTELLSRSGGKRKRKKYRSQSRKLDAAGGYRRIEARTPAEVERQLDAFLAMKAARFRKAGIPNVFAHRAMRSFLLDLFTGALDAKPRPFLLHGLEVGGRLRAVTGSSRFGDRLICEFGAIAEDELAHASPGDFLFFENIREAAEQGFAVYDFSVGDELYKRQWCDIETIHRDVVLPLTPKGRALAGAVRAANRVKAVVKRSPTLWRLTKALRRETAGKARPAGQAQPDDAGD
jgi:CelD/BcsL family acetyltransferase involved in cellulose biosynthesis